MNVIGCIVVGIFTLDMVLKTWVVSIYPDYYLNYLKNDETTEVEMTES